MGGLQSPLMPSNDQYFSNVGNSGRALAAWRLAVIVAFVTLVMSAVIAAVAPERASAASLAEKKALAAKITKEVDKLDSELAHLQERLRSSAAELADTNARISKTTADLKRQKAELEIARLRLAERLVTVYQSGSSTADLQNLVEAQSFDNLFDRLDAIERVGEQDSGIVKDIETLRAKVQAQKVELADARKSQASVVAAARKDRNKMAGKVDKRRSVLNSVEGDIRAMVDAQRRAAAAAAAAASRRAAATQRNEPEPEPAPAGGSDPGGAIAPSAPISSSRSAAEAASIAMQYIGTPYVWGGADPSGFDCSGLVVWSFSRVGISLPRTTYDLWNVGTRIPRNQLQTGDLIFTNNLGHMGIYVGGGNFVHSPRTGSSVHVSSLSEAYWDRGYMGAVRVG